MNYEELIRKPFLFNCWKHHLGFIKEELIAIKVKDEKDIKDFVKRLNVMGNSLSDLYTGLMSVSK